VAASSPDEAFARTVNQMGAATLEHLEAAKAVQAESARRGMLLSLAEVMVMQGIITSAMRESVEKRMQAQEAGGIQQLGQYKLLRKLGEGGMGAVYLAEDTMAQRQVALKVLAKRHADDAEHVKRFRREAVATGKLNHVNIVSAHTVGEDMGRHYYVMEYCDGETLDVILAHEHVLAWDWAVETVMQVARGLQHAHDRGFMHRDIKPGNVFITSEGIAKILDLGMSKEMGGTSAQYTTVTGMALGTPNYLSPEQARGDRNLDGRTDIYSLGATFYHLVTGKPPFEGDTSAVVMTMHLTRQVRDPREIRDDIPDGVAAIILKMLAKEPAGRYGNCQELLNDLERVMDGKMPGGSSRSAPAPASASAPAPAPVAEQARRTPPRRAEARATRPQQAVGTRQHDPVAPRGKQAGGGQPRVKTVHIAAGIAALGLLVFVAALVINATSETESAPAGNTEPSGPAQTGRSPGGDGAAAAAPAVAPAAVRPAGDPTSAIPPAPKVETGARPLTALGVDDPARWRNAVSLLPLVDPKKCSVAGTWGLENGKLVSDGTGGATSGAARIEIPYAPPEEYDFRIVFARLRMAAMDGGGDIVQVLPRAGQQFVWLMGGFSNSVMGFETIKGARVDKNPASVNRPGCIQSGRTYTAIVSVRKDGVKAYLDGALIAQCRTDYTDVSLEPAWKLRSPELLGLATYGSPTVFERAELLEVTGKGRIVRLAEVAAKVDEPKAPADTARPADPQPPVAPATEAEKEPAAAVALTSQDINTAVAGNTKQAGADGYDISGAGGDIYTEKDGFRFAFLKASGDCDIRVRVMSVQRTFEWAKAGLMVRQSLTAGAANASLVATPDHGCSFQRRVEPGGETVLSDCGAIKPGGTWLRLTRSRTAVTAYVGADEEGKKWRRVGSDVLELKDPILVGLCVTSHDNNKLCTASFRNLTLTAASGR